MDHHVSFTYNLKYKEMLIQLARHIGQLFVKESPLYSKSLPFRYRINFKNFSNTGGKSFKYSMTTDFTKSIDIN